MQSNFGAKLKIINLSATQADFYVDNVKVTFFANGWDELKQRENLVGNIFIASLNTIAVMKINTLFMRAKFRDYYDLYVLNLEGEYSLSRLYELTAKKMNNLSMSLFQRALTFTDDIEDESLKELEPKYNISIKEIENYFLQQVKNWNKKL